MELTIDKIQEYKKVKEFLDEVCEKYFDSNYDTDWQIYSSWSIDDNCEIVYIHYCYEEFWSNTEMYTEVDTIKVSVDELIKFSKNLTSKNKLWI